MSNHFFSINRGVLVMKANAVTRATTSTTGDDIELRVADGASLTRKDVLVALEAFKKVFESGNSVALGGTIFPPL